MIKTIISSAKSAGEKKILETALKYKIETKGYTCKNYKFDYEKFNLEPVESEKEADFKNIKFSDGLIYICEESFSEDDYFFEIKKFCIKKNIHFFYLDLSAGAIHQLSEKIGNFVLENGISYLMFKTDLYVKPDKTDVIKNIFESVVYLLLMKSNPEKLASPIYFKAPDYLSSSTSVESVVEDLIKTIPLKDRVLISKMDESELSDVLLVLGITILSKYYWPKNNLLLEDCVKISGQKNPEEFEIAEIIIKKLWENLKNTHKMRVLK
jgi:hypothetical protein